MLHNILPIIKTKKNRNITQRGTQTKGLGVMNDICSTDSQHVGPDRHPVNAGCSFFQVHERQPK